MLHDKSGGNPQLCMELAYLLVKRQIAKYVGGMWVLPQQIGEDELPSQMEQIISARLGGLPDAAHRERPSFVTTRHPG